YVERLVTDGRLAEARALLTSDAAVLEFAVGCAGRLAAQHADSLRALRAVEAVAVAAARRPRWAATTVCGLLGRVTELAKEDVVADAVRRIGASSMTPRCLLGILTAWRELLAGATAPAAAELRERVDALVDGLRAECADDLDTADEDDSDNGGDAFRFGRSGRSGGGDGVARSEDATAEAPRQRMTRVSRLLKPVELHGLARIRRDAADVLLQITSHCFKHYSEMPFYEAAYFTDWRILKKALMPQPRGTLHAALAAP
ncbi:hypothetical protein HK405_000822, partial [Cladochytrium tenue]